MKTTLLFLLAATVALPAADGVDPKPAKAERKAGPGRAAVIPDIDGVAKEDMAKFRAAFAKAQQDEAVKAAREKLLEKRKSMEFATAAEKKDARAELEALAEDVRKANRAAIAKADASLAKETIEKITDALEDKLKERAKEAGAGKKGADAKTPAKPFPFGDKAKTEEKKPEAAPVGK
jgi:hypothetical protein